MKAYFILILAAISLSLYSQEPDTIKVYDHYCESMNPHKIDTTYFWFDTDTLFIRNVHRSFCGPEELKASVTTKDDSIRIIVFNPSETDCLSDCSFGYTIKLLTGVFDSMIVSIFNEDFIVKFSDFVDYSDQKMITRNRKWHDLEIEGLWDGGTSYTRTHVYFIGKDTIINNTSYSILFDSTYYTDGKNELQKLSTKGFVREDSLKRVFIKYSNIDFETLLYNFNLNVGDKIKGLAGDYRVKAIDSSFVFNKKIKTLYLTDGFIECKWFEGIGCNRGFLYHDYMHDSPKLLCAYQNRELIYVNDDNIDCIYFDFMSSLDKPEYTELKIYPNPTKGVVRINSAEIIKKVHVINTMGKTVLLKNTKEASINIDLSNLDIGIYLIKIDNKVYKIIKN